MLRETIMGRELFDYAFKEYARRWAFKHPEPADLFRTMEDASGEDLDWFWRGWFFGTDACDIAIDSVKYARPDLGTTVGRTTDTVLTRKLDKAMTSRFDVDVSKERNRNDKNITFAVDEDTTLRDFYWKYARGIEAYDSTTYKVPSPAQSQPLTDEDKAKLANKHFYEVSLTNKGGLVMPVIIEWTYKDGTKEVDRIPAQVWRYNEKSLTRVFVKDKEVASFKLDPNKETADIDESNNSWNSIPQPSKFAAFKQKQAARGQSTGINPMQKAEEKKKGF
jgi:hypothetical protein